MTMMNNVIDWRPFKFNGNAYTLTIVPDEDCSTDDADCYTPADLKAHANGDWQFVTLIVTDENGEREYLGGCHYGIGGDWVMGMDDFLNDDYYAPAMARELEVETNA